MLRVVRDEDKVTLDPGQSLPGRGAYVHHDADCMEAAIKKGGLARTLRCKVDGRLLTASAAKAPFAGHGRGLQVSGLSEFPKESKDS
jgi:predicted RNA-binding protein YlxR (DUF448 family)